MINYIRVILTVFLVLSMVDGAGAKTAISYLAHAHNTLVPAWQKIVDEFNNDSPDIEVELTVAAATGDKYQEQILVMLAAGTALDVIYLAREPVVAAGGVLDIGPLADRDPEVPALARSLLPGVWELSKHGKTRYRVPIAIVPSTLFINTQLFAQSGLNTPRPDWTWGDFLSDTMKLTKHNDSGQMSQFAFGTSGITFSLVLPWVYQAGGQFYDNTYTPTTAYFDNDRTVEALQFLHDLRWQRHVAPQPGEVSGGASAQLANGQVAMFANWPARIAELANYPSLQWQIVRQPQYRRAATSIGFNGVYISRNSKNVEAAWEFLKYMAGPKAQAIYAPAGQVPLSRAILQSPEWLNYPVKGLNKQALYEEAVVGISRELGPTYGVEIIRIFDEVWDTTFNKNEISVRQAADDIQRRVSAFIMAQ